MQCKRMHGDRGRYLVNMGEKCNLMIPWTKVQKFSLLIWFKPHTSHCSTIVSTISITMDVKIGGATSFEKGRACSNKGRYAEFSWYNTLSLVNFFCY